MTTAALQIDELTPTEGTILAAVQEKWPRLYFARKHHRTTLDKALEFNNRLWLKRIYQDNSDQIVIQKASQIGITDWLLCDLFMHTEAGRPYLYVLPTDPWRNDFVPRRIDKQIKLSPYYRAHYSPARKDSDKKSQKVMFGTDIRFVGAQNPNNFYEFPCEVLAFDEYDKCDQGNVIYAFDRMAAADKELWRIVGNPTYSDYGVSVLYEESDRKEWHIKCEHCGDWQTIDWFVNVVAEGESDKDYRVKDDQCQFVCHRCEKPIDRLSKGEWVAEYPDREVSGYHVSQLFGLPHEIMPKMFDTFLKALLNQTKLQRFYNNILGLIYDPKGEKLTPQALGACVSDKVWPALADSTYVAGIDVGAQWHVHVSECRDGKRRKVVAKAVGGKKEVERILAEYNIVKGVIDAHGDLSAVREFAKDHSQWLMCEYNKQEKINEPYLIDDSRQVVHVNRTESMDASHAAYAKHDVYLPPEYKDFDSGAFVKQMCMPTRIPELNVSGLFTGRYIWTKGTDHHRHADNYELIAFMVSGSGQAFWPGGWV